jgi:hypothetical protein
MPMGNDEPKRVVSLIAIATAIVGALATVSSAAVWRLRDWSRLLDQAAHAEHPSSGFAQEAVAIGDNGGGGVRHARQVVGLTLLRSFETTGPVFEPVREFG